MFNQWGKIQIRQRELGNDHEDLGSTLNNLAVVLQDTGDFAGAQQLFEQALPIAKKALGPEHPDVAATLNNLALVLRDRGDLAGL